VFIAFAVLSLPISICDLRTFKIPNIYLLLLTYCTLPALFIYGVGNLSQLSLVLLTLVVLYWAGMGMGDIKLIALISLLINLNPDSSLVDFASCVMAVSIFHTGLVALISRSIPSRIALAPSIFAGLFLYLATR
jgi:Flp pilus assembly protein protease CpaA